MYLFTPSSSSLRQIIVFLSFNAGVAGCTGCKLINKVTFTFTFAFAGCTRYKYKSKLINKVTFFLCRFITEDDNDVVRTEICRNNYDVYFSW